MKTLRMLAAAGGMAAMLASGCMTDVAHAAGESASAGKSAAGATAQPKKPVSYPATLILCRPHQTCPP